SLGLALVSACGQTQASFPAPPPQIPLNQNLAAMCQTIATPTFTELPSLAPEGSEALAVQLAERAWWNEFILQLDGVTAQNCARYLELRDLVVAYNTQ